jgi:hypothetical protein
MLALHPQYITDIAGKKLVVLSIHEFNKIIEELEDLEDIKLYDEAKKMMMENGFCLGII